MEKGGDLAVKAWFVYVIRWRKEVCAGGIWTVEENALEGSLLFGLVNVSSRTNTDQLVFHC